MKPILFNTEMVRAILEGRKTQTRRVVKQQGLLTSDTSYWFDTIDQVLRNKTDNACDTWVSESDGKTAFTPRITPGDILWVRETWARAWNVTAPWSGLEYVYKASCRKTSHVLVSEKGGVLKWRPSIHMPKEAARIFLQVTDVQVERLKDIFLAPSEENSSIAKEGYKYGCDFIAGWNNTIRYQDLPQKGWNANPWVWVYEFERVDKPEGM
ncbi:MAG: hypothetical protein GX786_02055 [Clostridiales bacterium]|nr:hypothetical protein [Clostridiales bacterium]